LDYFSLVKRPAGLKAMIYVQYFADATGWFGGAVARFSLYATIG
jgi:hypothetical protein